MYYKPLDYQHNSIIIQKLKEKFKMFEHSPIQSNDDCIVSYDDLKIDIPELEEYFVSNNLEIFECFVFQTKPNDELPTHIDYDKFESPNIVLNWPIFNCENTRMNFFRSPNNFSLEEMVRHPVYDNEYLLVDPSNCDLVDVLELTGPHLIDVSSIHNVTNVTHHRLIMSFRFKTNPLHLWN